MKIRHVLSHAKASENALKAGLAIAAGYYFLQYALHPLEPHFIDAVNLVIHEAGHAVFTPFGKAIHIAGGSILQVLVPIVFAVYFWRRKDFYASGMVLYWVGQNLVNVSVYARDAMVMQLQLLGGDPAGHDWHNLLDMFGLLSHTAVIAQTIAIFGYLVLVAAFGVSLWFSAGTEWKKMF